jgi:hypothetical protein
VIIAHSARRGVGSAVNVLRQADARLLAQPVNAGRQLVGVFSNGIGSLPHVVIGSTELEHRRLLQLGNAGIAQVVSHKCEGFFDDASPYQR